MQSIPFIIIIVLTIYVAIGQLDAISVQLGFYTPLFGGAITGLLLGDLTMGLLVGGTMQMLTLGIATYGGASVPDYLSGSIIGTAYAIISGQGFEYGIAMGVPVGLLLLNLDVLGRMTNLVFQHKADRAAALGNTKGVETANILGILPWTLTRMIPVFIALMFGETVVTLINDWIPAALMTGLRTAAGLLPAMGMALLMRYLPLKKFWAYGLIGFVVMAYMAGMMTVIGISLLGLGLAGIYIMRRPAEAAVATADGDELEVEVEIDE